MLQKMKTRGGRSRCDGAMREFYYRIKRKCQGKGEPQQEARQGSRLAPADTGPTATVQLRVASRVFCLQMVPTETGMDRKGTG